MTSADYSEALRARLRNESQVTALRRMVLLGLEKHGWLKHTSDPDADSGWRAEQVDFVACEAVMAFPGRDWVSTSADETFDQFVALAVWNRQTNRTHSFANSAELFLAGNRAYDHRAQVDTGDKSGVVLLAYGLCLAASAPVAAFVTALMNAWGVKKGTTLTSNKDFHDFVGIMTSCALFLPMVYIQRRIRVLRALPTVATRFLPILLLCALFVFIEYRLAYDFVFAQQLDLPFSVSGALGSLLDDARSRWLYSGIFVVIALAVLQYSRFIGNLLPEEIEYSDDMASFLSNVIITVIAVAVSAAIKVLLLIVSWPLQRWVG